jgi:hypothetical protein
MPGRYSGAAGGVRSEHQNRFYVPRCTPTDRPDIVRAVQNPEQTYRLRAPASGREALAKAKEHKVYVDQETGEEMEIVSATLPLAPSASALVRSPENLRTCRRCQQLIGLDVSDCPYCGLRQPALDGSE